MDSLAEVQTSTMSRSSFSPNWTSLPEWIPPNTQIQYLELVPKVS